MLMQAKKVQDSASLTAPSCDKEAPAQIPHATQDLFEAAHRRAAGGGTSSKTRRRREQDKKNREETKKILTNTQTQLTDLKNALNAKNKEDADRKTALDNAVRAFNEQWATHKPGLDAGNHSIGRAFETARQADDHASGLESAARKKELDAKRLEVTHSEKFVALECFVGSMGTARHDQAQLRLWLAKQAGVKQVDGQMPEGFDGLTPGHPVVGEAIEAEARLQKARHGLPEMQNEAQAARREASEAMNAYEVEAIAWADKLVKAVQAIENAAVPCAGSPETVQRKVLGVSELQSWSTTATHHRSDCASRGIQAREAQAKHADACNRIDMQSADADRRARAEAAQAQLKATCDSLRQESVQARQVQDEANRQNQQAMEDLQKQNQALHDQIKLLEKVIEVGENAKAKTSTSATPLTSTASRAGRTRPAKPAESVRVEASPEAHQFAAAIADDLAKQVCPALLKLEAARPTQASVKLLVQQSLRNGLVGQRAHAAVAGLASQQKERMVTFLTTKLFTASQSYLNGMESASVDKRQLLEAREMLNFRGQVTDMARLLPNYVQELLTALGQELGGTGAEPGASNNP